MDNYYWNWAAIGSFAGAVATLIAATVAWCISKEWKEEKRSEILANKAYEIVSRKEEIDKKIHKYIKCLAECICDEYIERDKYIRLERLEYKYSALTSIHYEIDKTYHLIYRYRIKDGTTKKIYEDYKKFSDSFNKVFGYQQIVLQIRHKVAMNHDTFIMLINPNRG